MSSRSNSRGSEDERECWTRRSRARTVQVPGDRQAPLPADIYSGYDEYPVSLAPLEPMDRPGSRGSGLSNRLRTVGPLAGLGTAGFSGRLGTANVNTRSSTAAVRVRPITVSEDPSVGLSRPMTAIKGAGYLGPSKPTPFDPLNMAGSPEVSSGVVLDTELTVKKKIRGLQNKIWRLLDDSAMATCTGNKPKGLELAKEAGHRETLLLKQEEEVGFEEHSWDLSFSVLMNLAIQYEESELYSEALKYYEALSTQQFLPFNGPKIKLNIGNVYMKLKQPNKAIKIYRIALDQLGNRNTPLRLKLMHNTGLIFLQNGNLADAVTYFENIMQVRPSFKVGFHLVIANYMANDGYSAKRNFQDLLEIPLTFDDVKGETKDKDDPVAQLLADVLKTDALSKYENEKRTYAERCIITAARLIAPMIEERASKGFDWIREVMDKSKHATLIHALDISRAIALLKEGDISQAITIFTSFEKGIDKRFLPAAANNLSFIYFLRGEMEEALKYGNMAFDYDPYNGVALINLANCLAVHGNPLQAKELYLDGLEFEPSGVEGNYNLGLVNQELRMYKEALMHFSRVVKMAPNHADAVYQKARTLELLGQRTKATEWYLKSLGINQHDPGVLKGLAKVCDQQGDTLQAFEYYTDAFKYDPCNLEVINWLTNYLSERNKPDQAVKYYERGLALEPENPDWRLSIARCYRESGNCSKAIECYQSLLRKFPENMEAIERLLEMARRLGDAPGVQKYEEMREKLRPKDAWELVESPRTSRLSGRIEGLSVARTSVGPREDIVAAASATGRAPIHLPCSRVLEPLTQEQLNELKRHGIFTTPRSSRPEPEPASDPEEIGLKKRRIRSNRAHPITFRDPEHDEPELPPAGAFYDKPTHRPFTVQSARASTAKIRSLQAGLFDNIEPPDF